MIKFDLAEYKNSKIYFLFFDVYLKDNNIRKEDIFKELYINDSSYRRSRENEQRVGFQIIKQLSSHFGLVIPEESLINELQVRINDIYFKMYYKIDKTYDDDLKY